MDHLRLFSILLLLVFTQSLRGQDSTRFKNQLSIGSFPTDIDNNYFDASYKRFVMAKWFYGVSVSGWVDRSSGLQGKYYKNVLIPGVEYGASLPFLKICRFNVAARTSVYLNRSRTEFKNGEPGNYTKRTGVFIGPSLGLEVIPYKAEKFMISLYGYMHIGYGAMHNNYDYPTSEFPNSNEFTERTSLGVIATGIAIRF